MYKIISNLKNIFYLQVFEFLSNFNKKKRIFYSLQKTKKKKNGKLNSEIKSKIILVVVTIAIMIRSMKRLL